MKRIDDISVSHIADTLSTLTPRYVLTASPCHFVLLLPTPPTTTVPAHSAQFLTLHILHLKAIF